MILNEIINELCAKYISIFDYILDDEGNDVFDSFSYINKIEIPLLNELYNVFTHYKENEDAFKDIEFIEIELNSKYFIREYFRSKSELSYA